MRDLFDFFDINNDGKVSKNELIKGLQWDGNNPTKPEIDELLRDMNYKEGKCTNITMYGKRWIRTSFLSYYVCVSDVGRPSFISVLLYFSLSLINRLS